MKPQTKLVNSRQKLRQLSQKTQSDQWARDFLVQSLLKLLNNVEPKEKKNTKSNNKPNSNINLRGNSTEIDLQFIPIFVISFSQWLKPVWICPMVLGSLYFANKVEQSQIIKEKYTMIYRRSYNAINNIIIKAKVFLRFIFQILNRRQKINTKYILELIKIPRSILNSKFLIY